MSKAKKITNGTPKAIKSKAKSLTNSELQKLLKLRKAIFQMSYDRGYKVSKFDLNEDFVEFSEYFEERSVSDPELNILLSHIWNDADKIYIIFHGKDVLAKNHIQEYVDKLSEISVSKAIIVLDSSACINTGVQNIMNECAPAYMFEVFTEGELLLNPMKHILSPKYIPLNREETQQILVNEKVQISQLPRIRLTDPVAKYFGLRKGEVIKLEEKNEKGSHNTSYKVIF